MPWELETLAHIENGTDDISSDHDIPEQVDTPNGIITVARDENNIENRSSFGANWQSCTALDLSQLHD